MPRYVTKAASTLRRKAFRRLCHLASNTSDYLRELSQECGLPVLVVMEAEVITESEREVLFHQMLDNNTRAVFLWVSRIYGDIMSPDVLGSQLNDEEAESFRAAYERDVSPTRVEALARLTSEPTLREQRSPFFYGLTGFEDSYLGLDRLVERLKFLRQNRRPLEATPINRSIVDRSYQHEAIRRLAEAFAANKRRALLVMATGTGKTRVAMALIDVFLRSNQAQNVLFLADRDALVDQTLTDGFKAHLPHEPRDRIYTHQIDKTKRLFVATEQTLALCYAKFSPGFFDLIIFDEAHRSLFKRFTEVIEHFDARMIDLTATPANFIDRDTFRLFGCDANVPTFLYDYPPAVREGFLVDFSLYQAHTGFQRKGIKGVDLGEEDRNALAEQGIDPDSLDYAGTEIEVEVSNKDTLPSNGRKSWRPALRISPASCPAKRSSSR